MTPFQTFRSWTRTAPAGERAMGFTAMFVTLALLAWALSGIGGGGGSSGLGLTAGTAAPVGAGGAPVAADAGGATPGAASPVPGAGGGTAAAPAAGGATAADPAAAADPTAATGDPAESAAPNCAPGDGRGIADGELRIAITLTEIAGVIGNTAFGIPPPDDQQAIYDAVIASINSAGGVACRTLVPAYYTVNPADRGDLQAKCLDIVDDGLFAVLDTGSYIVTGPGCFAQNGIPYFSAFLTTERLRTELFPYVFASDTIDHTYRNTVFALRDLGFFDPAGGFVKLGVPYTTCNAEHWPYVQGLLHEIGVSDDRIVTYNFGCPQTVNPADMQQAVTHFQTSGVTHVLAAAGGENTLFLFTPVAERQGFRPRYGVADAGVIQTAYGTQPPDRNNMHGAIAITNARNGEERTPGMTPTAGTQACDAILTGAGFGTTWQEPPLAGNACNQLWMFRAAADNAPALQPEGLVAGLQASEPVDFSYPWGLSDFSTPGKTTAQAGWRQAQFSRDCACWTLVSPDFRPDY